jgi:predicted O-methyltransferase YrrM
MTVGWLADLFRFRHRHDSRTAQLGSTAEQVPIALPDNVESDAGLLERARTQWQFGDWESLAAISDVSFPSHPERVRLALMVGTAHAQLGAGATAKRLFSMAKEWGCSSRLLGQVLVSGVHNSLGRAAALAGDDKRALGHFERSIQSAMPSCDVALVSAARRDMQRHQLSIGSTGQPEPQDESRGGSGNALMTETTEAIWGHPRSTNSLDHDGSKFEKQAKDLNRVKDQREKLRREVKFLEYLIESRGSSDIYSTLASAKISLLSRPESAVDELEHTVSVRWIRENPTSWLRRNLSTESADIRIKAEPLDRLVEYLAKITNDLGAQPLWDDYKENPAGGQQAIRSPNQVRIGSALGSFLTWLTRQRYPDLIVEVGTALGVSGMYWAAGLEVNGRGQLVTFEPNALWQQIAERNIGVISSRFESICGTVEEQAMRSLPGTTGIDILFIDAIHTDEVVTSQLAFLKPRLNPGALVLLDDVNFSEDMRRCWQRLSVDYDVLASAEIKGRIGIIEYASRANR